MSQQIPHNYFPRSKIRPHDWYNKDSVWECLGQQQHGSLGVYDSFDKLDHTITDSKDAHQHLNWIQKPSLEPIMPKVSQKYRITVDVTGFDPSSIKTEIIDLSCGKKILVTGHQNEKHSEDGDFMLRHFRKTYDLPAHCEIEKLISYIVQPSTVVIEVPLKEKEFHLDADLTPKISQKENGEEILNLDFKIPEDIDPEHVHITIKDHDFVLKAEDKRKKPDGMSKFHYYKKSTLPHNTKFDDLKCTLKDNQISCTAPLNSAFQHHEKAGNHEKLWNKERPVFQARKYDFALPTKHANICI